MKKGDAFYLYFEENYHEAANDAGAVSSQMAFIFPEDAAEMALKQIEEYTNDRFVVDKEVDTPTKDSILKSLQKDDYFSVLLFESYQENFDYHFVVAIQKMKMN